MGGGGKGGSTSNEASIPKWAEDASKYNIDAAQELAKVGYMPWMGPDVAALTPMQEQAMQGTASAGSAFGLAPDGMNAMAGMPEAQDFGGGVRGYSSFPMYQQAKEEFERYAPNQAGSYNQMFNDPGTPEGYEYMNPAVGQMPQNETAQLEQRLPPRGGDPLQQDGIMQMLLQMMSGGMR